MTPKEKAKELVSKFRNEFEWVEKDHNVDLYRDTKQCALIAVDEIEQALTDYGRGDSLQLQNMDSEFRFWEQVEKEIEQLDT
jgi:hypothetical protein